jgi:hypothetical protein
MSNHNRWPENTIHERQFRPLHLQRAAKRGHMYLRPSGLRSSRYKAALPAVVVIGALGFLAWVLFR